MIPAALVVMAAGIRPSIRLAASAGLTTGRGIVVDDKLDHLGRRRLCARRVRGASRPVLRPGRARLRAGAGAGPPPRRPARSLRGLAAGNEPQGLGRARVLDRRLRGRGRRGRRCSRTERPASTASWCCATTACAARSCSAIRARRCGTASSCASRSGRAAPRRARLRQGLRGGRLTMSAQDFTDEQRRYLEGFVAGVQARRASQGLKPLGRRRRRPCVRARRPRQGRISPPWHASRRPARSSRPRRRPSATSIPSTPTRASRPRAPRASSPRASTTSAGASTACSTWRRRRTPTCAGCASPTAS